MIAQRLSSGLELAPALRACDAVGRRHPLAVDMQSSESGGDRSTAPLFQALTEETSSASSG
jgi:hypothetical protein